MPPCLCWLLLSGQYDQFHNSQDQRIGKVEECPIHIKSIVNEMRHLFGANFPYDSVSIAEFEYYLMEDLEFYTIVYHPYRPLQRYHLHYDYSFNSQILALLRI